MGDSGLQNNHSRGDDEPRQPDAMVFFTEEISGDGIPPRRCRIHHSSALARFKGQNQIENFFVLHGVGQRQSFSPAENATSREE